MDRTNPPYRSRDEALGEAVDKIGAVARLVPDKAFVFLKADGEEAEYFAHKTAFVAPSAFGTLREGQRVAFEAIGTSKGPRAQKIVLI